MNHNHEQNERFLFLMAAMAEACGQESTPFKEKIYAEALSDISIDVLEKAVWDLIRDRTTASFPKVGEIRERLQGKTEDAAIIALDKLEKAMRRHGKYASVTFADDPIINAVVSSMGGWVKLCCMELDDWKWSRKDFEKIYKAFAARPVEHLQIPGYLPGIIEITNSAAGYTNDIPKIEYVGKPSTPLLEAG